MISAQLAWCPQPIVPPPPPQPWNFVTLSDGPTINWNISQNEVANAKVTLGGNRVLSVGRPANGGSYVLVIKQDGIGSRTLALAGSWKIIEGGAGAIKLSTAPGAIDILAFTFDGVNFYATVGPDYS